MTKSRVSLTVPFIVACWLLNASFPFAALAFLQTAAMPGSEERERGIALYKQGQFADAAKVLRQVVQKNKVDDEGWYRLGLALLQQPTEAKNAAKAFATALKLRPNFAPAHVGLGYAFLQRNKLYDAMSEAGLALRIDPHIPDAHYILAATRLRAGANAEALKHAETTVQLDPQFSLAYLLKSQAVLSSIVDKQQSGSKESPEAGTARYREAAAALEQYLHLDPNPKERHLWVEQLASLRVHGALHRQEDSPNRVYSGREVTAKARVLEMPQPGLTEVSSNAQIKGNVVLRCVFAADGTVKHLLVIKGLPYGLTEQAVKSAQRIKFRPATMNGRPVSMFMQLEYSFNLL